MALPPKQPTKGAAKKRPNTVAATLRPPSPNLIASPQGLFLRTILHRPHYPAKPTVVPRPFLLEAAPKEPGP